MKLFICSLLVLAAGETFAQTTFQKAVYATTNINWGSRTNVAGNNSYLLAGSGYENNVGSFCFLAKSDSTGLFSMKRRFYLGDAVSTAAVTMYNNSLYAFGSAYSFTGTSAALDQQDLYLLKTDTLGNLISRMQLTDGFFSYFDAYGFDVLNTGSAIASFSQLKVGTLAGLWGGLLRLNNQGAVIWERRYSGADLEYNGNRTFFSKASDDGIAILSRTTTQGAGNADLYLIKTDTSGYPVWAKTFGTANDDEAVTIASTADSGFIMAGYTRKSSSDTDIYIVKTDRAGTLQWSKAIGSTASGEFPNSIEQTSDKGFIIAGYTRNTQGLDDGLVVKTDSVGNLLWAQQIGAGARDIIYSVVQAPDKGFLLGGFTESFGGSAFYFIKTDSTGTTLCNQTAAIVSATNPVTVVTTASLLLVDTLTASLVSYPATGQTGGYATSLCPSCQSSTLPTVTAGGPTSFCPGDSVRLYSSPAISYLWSTGATTSSILATANGNYTVSAFDSNGCFATSLPFMVTLYQTPAVTIGLYDDTLKAPNAASYQWYYFSTSITGATAQTYVATQQGEYSVRVWDTNGCQAVSNIFYYSLGINDPEHNAAVYPNPTTGSFTLHSDDAGTLILTDQQGRMVGSYNVHAGENKISFDSTLPDGLHFARLLNRDYLYKPIKVLLKR